MSDIEPVPAAQYLRMSTENQRYSLINQAEAIAQYAEARGYAVNRSYFDPGKSGLTLKERKGLQALLSDALRSDRDFQAVLVLDVSRWGRFQDLDQSAHYEFLCREAGVRVVYCGEPFENDGSAISAIVKQLKRLMAAEYSRDLSEKVMRAHLQQARLGFHQGGTRVYGMHRMVVDGAGRPRFMLEPGARKGVMTDRVVIIPGPPEELRIIRRIFRSYAGRGRSIATITKELNAEGVPSTHGRPWTHFLVRGVLKSELMIGFYVYNRSFQQMAQRRRHNPPSSWVRAKVMDPIVPLALFRRAGERLKTKGREQIEARVILKGMRRLLRERGALSQKLINACPYLPGTLTVRRVMGGLTEAYRRIGYVQQLPGWVGPDGIYGSNEQILALLRDLHVRQGHVTWSTITAEPGMPCAHVYVKRFGNLTRAYELAGIPHSRTEANKSAYRRSVDGGTAPIRAPQRGTAGGHVVSRFSNDLLLSELRRMAMRDGYVCARTIDAEPGLPTSGVFHHRFGSLLKAYELAGLPADRAGLRQAAQDRQAN